MVRIKMKDEWKYGMDLEFYSAELNKLMNIHS